MDFSKACTRDLVCALMERNDVEFILNTRSSKSYVASIEDDSMRTGQGEAIILIVKGLY
jgi:DNA polymerase II small subunit/DNA polymerase delta subunit B